MNLNEILSYKPASSEQNKRASNDADVFKAPLAKKSRSIFNSDNISATPGRTPRKVMAPGTPYVRGIAPSLGDPSANTIQKSNPSQKAANRVYGNDVEFVTDFDDENSGQNFGDDSNAPGPMPGPNRPLDPHEAQQKEDIRLSQVLEKLEKDLAKQDPRDQIPVIENENEAKRLLVKLKKTWTKNQQNRVKFEQDPNKFLESEIELATMLDHTRAFATTPEFMHLISEDIFKNVLIPGLSHQNIDICGAFVLIFSELSGIEETTKDEQEKAIEYVNNFIKTLLETPDFTFLELLVTLMKRLDEKSEEEATVLYNCLAIIENFLEVIDNQWILDHIYKSNLLEFLMYRIKTNPRLEPNMNNKLYCLEIISLLTIDEVYGEKFIAKIGDNDVTKKDKEDEQKEQKDQKRINGIEALMNQCSFYRQQDPKEEIEAECLQNVYNILISCLQNNQQNRETFVKLEGLQLMVIPVRKKVQSRHLSLKVLANVLAIKGDPLTKKMVQILITKCLALKSLSPLIIRPPKTIKKTKDNKNDKNMINITLSKKENIENIVAIFTAIFQELEPNSEEHVRLIQKFCENRCDKASRILELHQIYLAQVDKYDKIIIQEAKLSGNNKKLDADSYLDRLENGLYVLQMVDYIIVDLAQNGNEMVKEHLKKTMKMKNIKSGTISTIVREYATELVPLPESETAAGKSDIPGPAITAEKRERYANAEKVANKAMKYSNMFGGLLGQKDK